jgi:DNA-binding transcriptional MerR regulator
MTLAELVDALDVPARQIRFLIAEGVLPPALKTGRAADAYGDEHLFKAQRNINTGLH